MNTATPFLHVHNLRAGYGRAEVLHGLSLDAAKGSVITVRASHWPNSPLKSA
jgi:branched-chain amino acid transport system ATP-binding protein